MESRIIRQYTHYAITIFGLTGAFFISNCAMLKAYFLFLVLILLHWLTNGNECWISKIDYDGDPEAYSNSMFNRLGIQLTKIQTNLLNYAIMIGLISYTYFKMKRMCGFNLNSIF